MIFTKGKARSLRLDVKKNKKFNNEKNFMSGTKKMLPKEFNFQPPKNKDKIHQSEKPVDLIMKILKYVTNEYEIVVDQFSGSGSIMIAALKNNLKVIGFEINKEYCNKIKNRFTEEKLSLASI